MDLYGAVWIGMTRVGLAVTSRGPSQAHFSMTL